MNSITRYQEIKVWIEELTKKGYEPVFLQDGSVSVKDWSMLNGKARAGYDLVRLYSSKQVAKFINERE